MTEAEEDPRGEWVECRTLDGRIIRVDRLPLDPYPHEVQQG